MQYNREQLIGWLLEHEGEVLKPYRCSEGWLTIGVGRNLDAKGISKAESRLLLLNDIDETHSALVRALPWFYEVDPVRQLVLMDMAFNLGVAGLLKFTKFLSALQRKDYAVAASEMLDSKWAKQVKGRAKFLAEVMREQ